jgi:hypothetical protein
MIVKNLALCEFCKQETDKGNCRCGGNLTCSEYSPNKPAYKRPQRCKTGLSEILRFDIEDITGYGCTPRSASPQSILQEVERLLENVPADKGHRCLQIDNEIQTDTAE